MIRTLFGDATNKGGLLVVESDEIRFNTCIGRTVADDCFAGVTIKHSSHHSRLYFLDAIM